MRLNVLNKTASMKEKNFRFILMLNNCNLMILYKNVPEIIKIKILIIRSNYNKNQDEKVLN